VFPFTYQHLTDPVSGREGGRNDACLLSDTCPKSIEVNSANEYWNKTGSLNHTDTEGVDLPDPGNVRFFLISGGRHGVGNGNSRGVCQQFDNPTDAYTSMRALFVDLDEWVSDGTPPPNSRVPRASDGTGVFIHRDPDTVTGYVDQAELGFPSIPGVTFTGVATIRYLYDFGPRFYSDGIMDINPPDFATAPSYPSFVSKVDEDGNEIAGIRLPPVAAPTATTTGWALRREGFSLDDGCEAAGQMIPFATTKAERMATGDPRLSLEERYKTHGGYVAAVTQAARGLVRDRLMLEEDAQKYINAAAHSDVLQ